MGKFEVSYIINSGHGPEPLRVLQSFSDWPCFLCVLTLHMQIFRKFKKRFHNELAVPGMICDKQSPSEGLSNNVTKHSPKNTG